jgi:L-fuconolactonase
LDGFTSLRHPFLLEDFSAATSSLPVEKMVFLQCDPAPEQNLQEVEWVTSLAKQDPRLRGIVASGQLELGEGVRPYLDSLKPFSLVRGIRRLLHIEQDDRFCLQPDFIKGVQLLSDYGLSFDLCCTHKQLPNAVELVRQCPDVSIVVDHLGNPNIKDKVSEPWRDNITALAEMAHVTCKVSGAATAAGENWSDDDLLPYIEHVLSSFGFDRVMFGGDWPVVTMAATYREWVDALDRITSKYPNAERRKLFHDNAERIYRV